MKISKRFAILDKLCKRNFIATYLHDITGVYLTESNSAVINLSLSHLFVFRYCYT